MRRADLSQQVWDAIAPGAARLGDIEGELATIHAVNETFKTLDGAILAIGEPRLDAIPAPHQARRQSAESAVRRRVGQFGQMVWRPLRTCRSVE